MIDDDDNDNNNNNNNNFNRPDVVLIVRENKTFPLARNLC